MSFLCNTDVCVDYGVGGLDRGVGGLGSGVQSHDFLGGSRILLARASVPLACFRAVCC